MKATVVKINKKTFKLVFGLKVFRLLGQMWNVPGFSEIIAKFSILDSISGTNVTFEQLDVVNDLIIAAIQSNPENTAELDRDELDELFLADMPAMMELIQAVVNGLIEAMPKDKGDTGKPNAPAKKVRQ